MNIRRLMGIAVAVALLMVAVRKHCLWEYLGSDSGSFHDIAVRCHRVQFNATLMKGQWATSCKFSAMLLSPDADR